MDQRPRRTLHVSDATPNGDILLDFLGGAVWDALLVQHGDDFERLRDVLAVAIMTWNLTVMGARGRMPDGDAVRDFLDTNAQFFEVYSARKAQLFREDERLFLDVMIRIGEDGKPEVNALATLPDLRRRASSAPFLPRAQPRTRIERNRAKRKRRRA